MGFGNIIHEHLKCFLPSNSLLDSYAKKSNG